MVSFNSDKGQTCLHVRHGSGNHARFHRSSAYRTGSFPGGTAHPGNAAWTGRGGRQGRLWEVPRFESPGSEDGGPQGWSAQGAGGKGVYRRAGQFLPAAASAATIASPQLCTPAIHHHARFNALPPAAVRSLSRWVSYGLIHMRKTLPDP